MVVRPFSGFVKPNTHCSAGNPGPDAASAVLCELGLTAGRFGDDLLRCPGVPIQDVDAGSVGEKDTAGGILERLFGKDLGRVPLFAVEIFRGTGVLGVADPDSTPAIPKEKRLFHTELFEIRCIAGRNVAADSAEPGAPGVVGPDHVNIRQRLPVLFLDRIRVRGTEGVDDEGGGECESENTMEHGRLLLRIAFLQLITTLPGKYTEQPLSPRWSLPCGYAFFMGLF